MKLDGLKQRLLAEGCSPYTFCLEQQDGPWRVFYTERSKADAPIFESTNEVEACESHFNYVTTKFRHNHLVGYRVFVVGKDIFKARAVWDELPLNDCCVGRKI
jgi:hypothetical protein